MATAEDNRLGGAALDDGSTARRSALVRFYFSTRRALETSTRLLAAGYSGFWLGVFTRKQLHSIGELKYSRERFYWTDEYNERGLWDWERRAVERHFAGCGSLLLAGAGGGREVLALRRLGIEVDGFDSNAGLVRVANELLEREGMIPDIRLAPWDRCPQYERKFDGAIVGWGVYTLIRGRDRRVMFLRELRDRVEVGSPILLSFHTRSGNSRTLRGVAMIGNILARILGRDPVEVGDYMVPDYVHYFAKEELQRELVDGGFEPITFETVEFGHSIGRAI